MKHKKLLSILLASAMIGTAPASAWASDITDMDISAEESITEESAGEETPEQPETDSAENDAEEADSEALQEDTEDLQQSEEAADPNQGTAVYSQNTGDAFSDGTEDAFSANETAAALTLKGTGTEADPYLVTSTADIQTVADYVNNGKGTFAGQYLKFTNDITLPTGWTPIGTQTSAFAGIINGDNHLLTVPKGEKCIFGYTSGAALKNLNVYGEQIASDGLVENYKKGTTISFDNVTLKSGTKTLKSGFLGGYASGSSLINITNCTVEKGVVIGYDKAQSNIGSFGGDFNGTIQNCVSYADVYGTDYVGGICGNKGQTMSTYVIKDCKFYGTVTASGNYAGGISGGGYGGTQWGIQTAPNTPGVTIQNCYSNGTITAQNYVGGILGAEAGMVQCWDNGIQYIQNNTFEGTVTAKNGSYVGGVIGYINGLDKYNVIENNTYGYIRKNMKGIGFIKYVDTSYADPTAVNGVTYYNTANGTPENAPSGATKTQQNRTDDPLGKDAEKLTKLVAKQIKVTLTILGDQNHDSDKDHNYHTYYAGNLDTWLKQSEYTVVEGSTVKNVIDAALLANNMTCENPSGNYIESVTKDGKTLAAFDNGKYSGWMYTLNGVYPELGVSEQEVKNNDQIVFHYTDYYPEEDAHVWSSKWTTDASAHWHECENKNCKISSNSRKNGYGKHTFDNGTITKNATYKEKGIKTYKCTVCGYEKTEEIPVIPHNHSWDSGKITKAATCKDTGVKTYTCTLCGDTKTETLPMLAHTYDNGKVTKAPTCKDTGVKTYTCTVCGKTKTETIPVAADNHKWDNGKVTKAATCKDTGVKTYTCTVCGKTKTETIPIAKDSHKWDNGKVTKAATCKDTGVKTYTCTVCGKTKTETIPIAKDSHKWDNGKVTKAATCKEKGVKTYTCTVCGKTKTEELPLTAHIYDNGKITKAATCKNTGVKTYTCTVCGATKTETLPKTAHKYVWKTTTKATVFKPAKQTWTCSTCGYKTKKTRNYGKKLTPTLKLTATRINLKVKQSTGSVKATGLANGDSVRSWTSSNKNIAAVNSKGVIRAGSRPGKAKITVTLKSGKKGYITVTVQKAAVKTSKITGIKSSLTLNSGKRTTLKPVLSPITSAEKITYTSSNKNVAVVNSKGVITAKKKGRAVITVKSGSKKVTCKVTVK